MNTIATPAPAAPLIRPNMMFAAVLAVCGTNYLVLAIGLATDPNAPGAYGDFIAFWAAAKEALSGNVSALYGQGGLTAAISTHVPQAGELSLSWQYPPHMMLLLAPLGLLPLPLAYGLWCAGGLSAFYGALHLSGMSGRPLIALLLTPPVFVAILTGQNGLFTASLLLVLVFSAPHRPIIAGLTAAALTMKPQLGLFVPIAFLCAGYWRATGVAAVGSLGLVAVSSLIFGTGPWSAFLTALWQVSDAVSTGTMPLYKMVSFYSASVMIGLSASLAQSILGLAIISGGIIVGFVWRRTKDNEACYAVLACATLLATPYAFYYELTILLPAVYFMARHAYKAGQHSYLLWVATLFVATIALPGPVVRAGISWPFTLTLAASLLIAVYNRPHVMLIGGRS